MCWVVSKTLSLHQGWFAVQTVQQSCRSLLLSEEGKIYVPNLGKLHAGINPA